MSRLSEYKGLESAEHLRRHDSDLDGLDETLDQIRSEVKSIKTILIGALVSTATASIGLALNLLIPG